SQNSGTKVSLIYSNRNEQQIIFKEALHELEVKYHDRLKVIHVLEEPPVDWTGVHGLLNQENLRSIFNKLPLREEDTIYMLCGPEGMMVNAEGLLKNEGIQAGKIMIERFTASVEVKKEKAGKKGSGKMSNVTIVQDGREQTITVSYGASILKTALDQGLDLPFSCQSGVCTACRCKKITGEVNIEDAKGLTEEEIKAGYVLICVGKPAAEEIKLEVG
ncbi:MAG: 2Fe-2S iron-sulfur cluster-binding protein, partial [Cyclobacteriaceae bacterium]|nr:2Fe-2S iron-sulfur cluster-binding protein [Cyclobacteriaceae bacterium]